jgi:hypothetical protein
MKQKESMAETKLLTMNSNVIENTHFVCIGLSL